MVGVCVKSHDWCASPGGGGGATTGPDVTQPPAICQTWAGGQFGVGGRLEGGGGGGYRRFSWEEGPNVGGPVRDPLLPHAYLQGGRVSWGLGVWRYACDNSAFLSLPGTALEPGKSSECSSLRNKRHLYSAPSW